MNKREIGDQYEKRAIEKLEACGYQILEKNYRCRFGEIDIIAKEGCYLVFLEVKYRKTKVYGGAISAVSLKKQKTISKVAGYYLLKKQYLENTPCRFDVVAITDESLELVKNAFDYQP